MGFIDWCLGLFRSDDGTVNLKDYHYELSVKAYAKKLAIETCIDIIAKTLVRCEFQTFEKGKETIGNNYYLLNVSPNDNQNASEFIHSLVNKLIKNNECLVIMQSDQLFVADAFTRTEYALKENEYTNVTVKTLSFNKVFFESDVLYFKLNDSNIMSVINELHEDYGKILDSAIKIYKRSNAKRVIVEGDFLRPQSDEHQAAIDEMFNTQFKSWFEADNAGAVFQLQKDYKLTDVSGNGKSGTPTTNSRDIRAVMEDIFDFIAMAFHVPRGMLKGDLADVDKQTDNFLMFGILPLIELITDEFNRKMYKKESFLDRTYLKMDSSKIKILDIVNLATAADKFFAIGVNNIDDNLRMLGREPLNEDYSQKRYVTKNYESVDAIGKESKGGEGI